MTLHKDVLIVGGGLAGLALASDLETAGFDYLLVEARHRFGGRVLSAEVSGTSFDLGPAWFWPGQPRIAKLIADLQLESFDQFSTGDALFQDNHGVVHRGAGFASMAGAFRLSGGISAITDALASNLPADRLIKGVAVDGLTRSGDGIVARLAGEPREVEAACAVLAVPPRLIAHSVEFSPALPDAVAAMRAVPTWMAGHAKVLAVYERPHWREAGLSGDAASQRGPLMEIHDASPSIGGPYALFGFVGVPPEVRVGRRNEVLSLVAEQLVQLFGQELANPLSLTMQDWVEEPFTATLEDHEPLRFHPAYGRPPELAGLWGGQLIFASTEVAATSGGLLEGALEAAAEAFHILTR